jgi:DNA-binding transcriptional regulator YiaG
MLERSVRQEHIEDLGGLVVKVWNAVIVHRCSACGDEMIAIPDIQGLARAAAIARALNPTRLSGKEVRFIRRALDMTQKDFAAAMELSPEYVSRWENDHSGIGGSGEKLVRPNVCALLQKEGVCEYDPKVIVNMRFCELKEGETLPPIEMVRVRITHRTNDDEGTWSEAA